MSAPDQTREPILNLPPAIISFLGLLIAVHAGRVLVMAPEADDLLIWTLGFVPNRYDMPAGAYPGGQVAVWTSPLTYALLHANWTHLIFNGFWLAAFGSILARRIGSARFVAFSVLGTLFAALGFYLADPHSPYPVIGASGAISAHVGAATRFMFQRQGAFTVNGTAEPAALSLAGVFANRSAFLFVLFWLGSNVLFGAFVPIGSGGGSIAWQAHLGGFLFGLIAFSLFDRRSDPTPGGQG